VAAAVVTLTCLLAGVVQGREAGEPFAGTLLMDAESGMVLEESDGHRQWPPASMVKMMVMLLSMEAVAGGKMSLDDPVRVSAWASRMGGSQVYLSHGEVFPLRELLKAVVIGSANDAAVAVAEHVAGSTTAFIERMNKRARQLGMKDTQFRSVHGLPPSRGQQDDLTTPYDLALLAREVLKHEQIIEWATTPKALFRNGTFELTNTNRLIRKFPGATGLKTGYHRRAGYGVTATATRSDLTLIAVVMGSRSKRRCFDEAAALLEKGFSTYKVVRAAKKGRQVGTPVSVEGGDATAVRAIATDDLRLLVKRMDVAKTRIEARLPRLLTAPVEKGQQLGTLVVLTEGGVLGSTELVSDRDVAAVGWLQWWRNFRGPTTPEPEP
jgi:D-alanyl-D-alanine carboxypeptidase (penicillin-binding protein 5/6)